MQQQQAAMIELTKELHQVVMDNGTESSRALAPRTLDRDPGKTENQDFQPS